MTRSRRLCCLLAMLLPLGLVPGCSDQLSTRGQLITCDRTGANCKATDSATPAEGMCTDIDEDGDGDDSDSDDEDSDGVEGPEDTDDDNDGVSDDADSDDDSDGIGDADDCDELEGGDDDDD
jgi:hypothetical protein